MVQDWKLDRAYPVPGFKRNVPKCTRQTHLPYLCILSSLILTSEVVEESPDWGGLDAQQAIRSTGVEAVESPSGSVRSETGSEALRGLLIGEAKAESFVLAVFQWRPCQLWWTDVCARVLLQYHPLVLWCLVAFVENDFACFCLVAFVAGFTWDFREIVQGGTRGYLAFRFVSTRPSIIAKALVLMIRDTDFDMASSQIGLMIFHTNY